MPGSGWHPKTTDAACNTNATDAGQKRHAQPHRVCTPCLADSAGLTGRRNGRTDTGFSWTLLRRTLHAAGVESCETGPPHSTRLPPQWPSAWLFMLHSRLNIRRSGSRQPTSQSCYCIETGDRRGKRTQCVPATNMSGSCANDRHAVIVPIYTWDCHQRTEPWRLPPQCDIRQHTVLLAADMWPDRAAPFQNARCTAGLKHLFRRRHR